MLITKGFSKINLFILKRQILQIAFIFTYFFNKTLAQSIEYIYNPLPIASVDVSKYGRELISIQFVQQRPELAFLSFESEGIYVIDFQNNNQLLVSKQLNITQVQLVDFNIFALTQDLGIILMYYNQTTYEIIVKGTFNPTQYIINTFFITGDSNYIILGVNCYVKVMKIIESALNQNIVSNTNFLQEKSTSGLQCLSNSNHIFANNAAIILSSIRDGVHLFYFKNIESPTYVKSLVKICQDVQQTYLMQNLPILFTLSKYYEVVLIDLGIKFKNQDPSFSGVDEANLDYFSIEQMGGSKTYNYMLIDDEEEYMYLGIRTNGIVVYDLRYLQDPQVSVPIVVQELKSLGLANWISFAPHLLPIRQKYDYLFISDGSSFKIFQKVPVNLNSNIINLYNSDNCIFSGYTSDQWPWSVVTYSDSNQYFAISSGYAGMYTFYIDQYGQLYNVQEAIKRYDESHDGILYLKNRKVIVLGQSGQGMAFYNATNPEKLTYINEFKLIDKQNDCDDITTDKQERYLACANGFQGIYILQVEDFMKPILWAEGDMILKKNGVESVIVDDQLKFGFYAVREEGVGAFQIIKNNGVNTITQTKYFATLGAEYLRFHIDSDQKLVLVADGYQGLTIIDCKDYLNPQIIKQIPVQGWAVKFTQLQANPSTVIVTQMEKGQISVIDISTISEATKISALQFGSESAFGIASHPSNKYIIFTLSQGMRICNTVNTIRIHTQINRQSQFTSQYYPPIPLKSLSSSEKLYIGENVQLITIPYYIQRIVKLSQIYYYHNYQLEQLPSWIKFIQYQSTISIVPNLDALNNNQGFNILLIYVLIPIYPTDFMMRTQDNPPNVIVNQEQSQRIFNKLIQIGLLSEDGYVSDFFQSQMKLDVDWYKDDTERQLYKDLNDQILSQIKRIFTRAQFKYPIQFLVNGSLKFNYSKEDNSYPLIQSFSSIITISMNILKEKVQFVKQKFDGLIFSYSSNQQIFQIQGDIQQLNTYLNTKIIIYDPQQEHSSSLIGINIQVNITDNINNPLTSQEDISVYNFIKKKKQIVLLQNFQSQYENQYPDGLTAQESFTIIIDKQQIQVEQDLVANIQVSIQSGDKWIDINIAGEWISFDDFQIKGNPPLDSFNNKFDLQIIVSDGYSETSQFLEIKVAKFPIKQIMIIVAILVSVLILFFVLFIFRRNIHFIVFQKYHSHQQEILYSGEIYQKKIVFAPNVYEQTLKIFNLVYKSFNYQEQDIGEDSKQKKIQAFISNYRSVNSTNNYDEFFKDAFQIYQNNIKQFTSLPENEFKYNDTRIKIALKSYLAKFILNNNAQMLKIYKRLKKYTQSQQDGYCFDWYKSYVEEIQNLNLTPKNQSINTSSNQPNSLNESENKLVFGSLEIKTFELQNALEQILDSNDVNLEYDFYILTEAIKADYYGFDYQTKPRIWRSSIGEVIHSQINNINPLSVYRKIELEGDKNSLLNKLRQIFWTNYKWIGSYKKHLPDWLGYEMFDNLMILSGIPKKQHQGEYKVLIYNSDGYVSQSVDFMIKQKSKRQNLDKSLYQDSPSLNKKRTLDQNQINLGNNLNSSLQFNLNQNNFMSEKFNYGSPLHLVNKRISQYQKQNSKGAFTKFNTDENINQFKIKSNGIPDLNSNNIFGSVEIQEQRQMTEYQKEYESVNSLNTNQFIENQRQVYVPQSSQLKIPNQQILIPYLLSPPISQANRENLSIFHSQNNLRKQSNQEYQN
ncbi:transmembrane protein, putative (macronuclear) [Tetrahymena thermophila SB210]|uniref:Transmembrane protein, putative n=1 Tax=Tetrahymena thermophila (strain SB210) TaxID=312017 RepID=Q237E6_TETTS|nr:transmembrane protein, putative [Tetrahymena thermophila SB210]EAR92795.2 transmembrane protein, putative [Tetrahymena thermophila SB210]|eukprot:XP_001013040.2 transmembrane protein, putative [Tetrahymena thermophila SB210]